jgi:hypothetical protein
MKLGRTEFGPLLINHDPDSPREPATPLDKYTHTRYLQRQSPYCFKVPVHSPESPPQFVGFLQFDAMKQNVRDLWVLAINAEFAATGDVPLEPAARRVTISFDTFLTAVGKHDVDADLASMDARAWVAAVGSHGRTVEDTKTEVEVKLEQFADNGDAIPYVWEATASGSIAGTDVLNAEDGKGAIAVQIRNLLDVVRDYDGEVAVLRIKAGWDGDECITATANRSSFPRKKVLRRGITDRTLEVRESLTRLHEIFFQRKYQFNLLHQLASLYPRLRRWASCCSAVCSSTKCCCCCFGWCNDENVFCSEFVANVYQAAATRGAVILTRPSCAPQ